MRLLLEPFGGLAGDMLLAALLDLGDPRFRLEDLTELVETLVPGECRLQTSRVRRGGIAATHLEVRTPESGSRPHRRLPELLAMLADAPLPEGARARAGSVLHRLAEAEGRVHERPAEEVTLHEVGAVDTLVDVAGTALALERLEVSSVVSTPPLTGEGTVRCAHGEMPVPVPAVLELLAGAPLVLGGGAGERLTPTGAAWLAELVESWEPPGLVITERTGYGAGTRDPREGPPNLCRASLCRAAQGSGAPRRTAWLLECHLDDATGEEVAHAVRGLLEAGALDAWTVPLAMKKGRPGVLVAALCRADARDALERVLFERTPTLGLRWSRVERTELEREVLSVELEGLPVRVKRRVVPGRAPRRDDLSPEHDDLAAAAAALGIPLREAERRVIDAAWSA